MVLRGQAAWLRQDGVRCGAGCVRLSRARPRPQGSVPRATPLCRPERQDQPRPGLIAGSRSSARSSARRAVSTGFGMLIPHLPTGDGAKNDEFVVKMQRHQLDGEIVGNGGRIGREPPSQAIRSSAICRHRVQLRWPRRVQPHRRDHGPAPTARPWCGTPASRSRLPAAPRRRVGRRGGEELLAIDQVQERHRLAAQGVNDVAVIDHVAALAAGMRSAGDAAGSSAPLRRGSI